MLMYPNMGVGGQTIFVEYNNGKSVIIPIGYPYNSRL